MNEEVWNKTGIVCGGLNEVELATLIVDSRDFQMRLKLLDWLRFLLKENKTHFVVSFPYEGTQKPTVEE